MRPKRLNFYPFYEDLLRSRRKTTTFRLSDDAGFSPGDEVVISVGWKETQATDLSTAHIKQVYSRRICDLSETDFEGESPDCRSREATRLVLSCIYRTVVADDAAVWVIKFSYNDSPTKELV